MRTRARTPLLGFPAHVTRRAGALNLLYQYWIQIARDVSTARGLRSKPGQVFGGPGWAPAP